MGGGGATSGGTYVRVDGNRLDKEGKPNSRYDLYVGGKKKQSRWYDHEGKAIRNRDYFHQDPKGDIPFPHDHPWNWSSGKGERYEGHDIPPDPNFH